jgi:hypothetical protein
LEAAKENNQSISVHHKCVDKYCHKKTIQKTLHDKAELYSSKENILQANQKGLDGQNSPHSYSLNTASFVEKSVMYKKIQNIQTDGDLHIYVEKGILKEKRV